MRTALGPGAFLPVCCLVGILPSVLCPALFLLTQQSGDTAAGCAFVACVRTRLLPRHYDRSRLVHGCHMCSLHSLPLSSRAAAFPITHLCLSGQTYPLMLTCHCSPSIPVPKIEWQPHPVDPTIALPSLLPLSEVAPKPIHSLPPSKHSQLVF